MAEPLVVRGAAPLLLSDRPDVPPVKVVRQDRGVKPVGIEAELDWDATRLVAWMSKHLPYRTCRTLCDMLDARIEGRGRALPDR